MDIGDILLIIIKFAGAVVVFIFGMKLMSEGLQKVAGGKMRSIMGRMTNNPFRGIVTGAAVTAAIQSSTATTVMVVSFVNSGLLTLAGAIAVVMGANIGTTITSWIILLGMGGGAEKFVIPLIIFAIAAPFILMKGDKVKSISEFIVGFGTLLLGLQFLQDTMPDLIQNTAVLDAIHNCSGWGFWSILLFIAVGTILTVLIQASSAVMAITLVMTANGWIGFEIAVAIIMGQNIGTTLTANIAASVANTAGKKAARAHFVFNMVGTILTLIVLYPELNIQAAQNEIESFSKRILRMFTFLPLLRTAKDDEDFYKTLARIEKYESISDRMEMEIAQFLTKTAAGDLSQEGSRRISSMLRIVDNLESIGDTIFQIAMTRKNKRDTAVHFDQGLNDNLTHDPAGAARPRRDGPQPEQRIPTHRP